MRLLGGLKIESVLDATLDFLDEDRMKRDLFLSPIMFTHSFAGQSSMYTA